MLKRYTRSVFTGKANSSFGSRGRGYHGPWPVPRHSDVEVRRPGREPKADIVPPMGLEVVKRVQMDQTARLDAITNENPACRDAIRRLEWDIHAIRALVIVLGIAAMARFLF